MMSEAISTAETVGRQVRVAMVERGQSQTDVALAVGMTVEAMSRRINGRVSFRADELIRIAAHLGVDVARFFRPLPRPRAHTATGAAEASEALVDDVIDEEPARARGAA